MKIWYNKCFPNPLKILRHNENILSLKKRAILIGDLKNNSEKSYGTNAGKLQYQCKRAMAPMQESYGTNAGELQPQCRGVTAPMQENYKKSTGSCWDLWKLSKERRKTLWRFCTRVMVMINVPASKARGYETHTNTRWLACNSSLGRWGWGSQKWTGYEDRSQQSQAFTHTYTLTQLHVAGIHACMHPCAQTHTHTHTCLHSNICTFHS